MDYLSYFNKLEDYDNNFLKEKQKMDLNNSKDETKFCKNCNQNNKIIYDYNNYNKVCSSCGFIFDSILDESAEWRYYGHSDSKNTDTTRCGNPINSLLPKSSMGTTISGSSMKYNSIKRLQKWNQISNDERSEYEVFKKIDNFLNNSKINTKIIDDAKLYYKLLCEKDDNDNKVLTRGKNRLSLIVACIYISSKNNNKPINEKKLLKKFNIKKKDLTKGLKKFSIIEKEKNININNNNNTIHNLINMYGKQFNLNDKTIKIVHLIYIRSHMINILKNSGEKSICSGLFYFFSSIFNLNLSKKIIIDKINISEVTLNKTYNIFTKHMDILLLGFDKIKFIN